MNDIKAAGVMTIVLTTPSDYDTSYTIQNYLYVFDRQIFYLRRANYGFGMSPIKTEAWGENHFSSKKYSVHNDQT